jgi:hypothetical protein
LTSAVALDPYASKIINWFIIITTAMVAMDNDEEDEVLILFSTLLPGQHDE